MQATIAQLQPQIWLAEFADCAAMCQTLMRFQEHYESPRFKGQVFTRAELLDWYTPIYGEYNWDGFNFPSRVLTAFRAGKFNPLDNEERAFLDLCAPVCDDEYVIIVDRSRSALLHEYAHAMYAVVPEYRKAVDAVLAEGLKQNLGHIFVALEKMGYERKVLMDEAQAYMVDGLNEVPILGQNFEYMQMPILEAFYRHGQLTSRSA